MSIRWKILACLWLAAGNAVAQDALPYQTPPAEILQLADVQRPPSVVADSGKFGHSELVHLCPLRQVDRMVVDGGLSQEWRDRIAAAGIDLVIAD